MRVPIQKHYIANRPINDFFLYDKYGKMVCIEQAELDVGTNEVTFVGVLPADAYWVRIFAI